MFDQILQLVKESMANHPEATAAMSNDQADALHKEIAGHITDGLQNQAPAQAGAGGILSELENSITSGNILTGAVAGGLISSLAGKFGLPSAATGAIVGALPGLIQKFTQKAEEHKTADVIHPASTS